MMCQNSLCPLHKQANNGAARNVKASQACIDLIKRFTILHFNSHRTERGWTIGYDHYSSREAGTVYPNMVIDEREADRLLALDIRQIEYCVNDSVLVRLCQNQFDALVSYIKSTGTDAFLASDLLRKLNGKDQDAAAMELIKNINDHHSEHDALVRRRYAELKLFINEPAP